MYLKLDVLHVDNMAHKGISFIGGVWRVCHDAVNDTEIIKVIDGGHYWILVSTLTKYLTPTSAATVAVVDAFPTTERLQENRGKQFGLPAKWRFRWPSFILFLVSIAITSNELRQQRIYIYDHELRGHCF